MQWVVARPTDGDECYDEAFVTGRDDPIVSWRVKSISPT